MLKCTDDGWFISEEEMECLALPRGFYYLGYRATSRSGNPCISWNLGPEKYRKNLPDENTKAALRYCRYIPHQNWTEPSCLVKHAVGITVVEPCDIPYCGGNVTWPKYNIAVVQGR